MKNSEYIASFLKFLKDIQTEYNIATDMEEEANKETQDILHRLELGEDSYHDMAKMSKIIKSVRLKRRKAKDTKTEAEPVMQWVKENPKFTSSLERLLGEVRKAEKYNTNRHYMNKTDILNGIGKDNRKNMNKRQKKKIFKKRYGFKPPKGISFRNARLAAEIAVIIIRLLIKIIKPVAEMAKSLLELCNKIPEQEKQAFIRQAELNKLQHQIEEIQKK